MLFTLLLVTALAGEPAQSPALATLADAVQMANDGRDEEALAAFQRLVTANPNDREARIWIGRLHERMGHPERAEPVYRSVVLEDRTNVEALLGLASSLMAQNAPREALEALERAEELEPQNEAVLESLGQAHRRVGSPERAVGYFERVSSAAPTEQHQIWLEGARRQHQHRVEARGFNEQFSGTAPDSSNGELAVNYRLNDRLRVFGRGEVQRKLGVREARGGGGAEWRWKQTLTLRAHALVAPDKVVMPEGDFLGEVQYVYGPAVWTYTYRHFDITGARVAVLTPSVSWPVMDRVDVTVRYALSVTESNTVSREIGHSVHLRGAYQWRPRISVLAGYAAGVEDFDHFSIDRIGNFRANTVSIGGRYDLRTLTAVVAMFERQARRGGVDMNRVTLSVAQSF
jgi:YaiO family outer membrane protein